MTDIIQQMLDAFNKEWLLWDWEADNPGDPSTQYTVRRDGAPMLRGDFYEALSVYEKESNRAAMREAARVLLQPILPLGERKDESG